MIAYLHNSGKNETEPDPDDSESSDFIPAYQAREQPNQWGIGKEEEVRCKNNFGLNRCCSV